MSKFMHKFLRDETGATAIEYGLIAALMVLVIIGSITTLGQTIETKLYGALASL